MLHNKRTLLMTTLTSLTALSFSLLSANALADNAPIFSQLQNQLNSFGKEIQSLSQAQQQSENSYRYQNDPQMVDIANNNAAVNIATQNTSQNTNELSDQSLQNALKPMSDATLQPSNSTVVAVNDPTQASDAQDTLTAISNSNKDYSWGITASDTLFANYNFTRNPNSNYQINGTSEDPVFYSQPTSLHDNYLDFTNFIEPTSLNYNDTDGGSTSADKYVQFLTKDYQPLYNQLIDLKKLNQKVSSADTSDHAASITRYLATSTTFQQAQTTIRQAIAQKSAAMYVLHKIQSERSAITSTDDIPELDTIAQNMGIEVTKNSDGEYVYPSKAQIDYYQSHHDLNSESWYQNLQTLSAPNVQRETLITLKQIQQSLAQQHQDNETIQALLAIDNIRNSQNSIMSLSTAKKTLGDWLDNLDPSSPNSPDSNSSGSSSASSVPSP